MQCRKARWRRQVGRASRSKARRDLRGPGDAGRKVESDESFHDRKIQCSSLFVHGSSKEGSLAQDLDGGNGFANAD